VDERFQCQLLPDSHDLGPWVPRCPICRRPLYLYLGKEGPAWTCRCAGPELLREQEARERTRRLRAAAKVRRQGI
jgi:hypothetical protein